MTVRCVFVVLCCVRLFPAVPSSCYCTHQPPALSGERGWSYCECKFYMCYYLWYVYDLSHTPPVWDCSWSENLPHPSSSSLSVWCLPLPESWLSRFNRSLMTMASPPVSKVLVSMGVHPKDHRFETLREVGMFERQHVQWTTQKSQHSKPLYQKSSLLHTCSAWVSKKHLFLWL